MHLLALWAFLQTKMTDFPTLSYTPLSKLPTLKPDRGTPLWGSLLVLAIIGSTPLLGLQASTLRWATLSYLFSHCFCLLSQVIPHCFCFFDMISIVLASHNNNNVFQGCRKHRASKWLNKEMQKKINPCSMISVIDSLKAWYIIRVE